ncbi:MAG: two-component regulator propeller domain-containing protein [Bacteroidota bacterium]|nr:two-component regulator propeller domain-containing protein [Bacteroidota bacterium]
MRLFLTLLLATSFSFVNLSKSQPISNKIRKISTVNGLTNNVVYSIVQDKLGFLWFATEDGLNRYDGYSFTSFRHDPTDKHSISGNFIQCLYCDSKGNVWIGTSENGLNRFDYNSNQFERFVHDPSKSFSICNNDIVGIAPGASGNIWVASYRDGVNSYNPQTGRFYQYKDIFKTSKTPNYLKVTCIKEGTNKVLWVGTQGNGLYAYNLVSKKTTEFFYQPGKKGIPSNTINSIFEDSFHNIWIATRQGVAMVSSNGTIIDHPIFSLFRDREVFTIFCDNNLTMWLGTDQGIFKFDLSTFLKSPDKVIPVEHLEESSSEFGLSYRSVRAIYQDRDKNMWIGTYTGGIDFISCFPEKFRLITNKMDKNALSYNKVWGMCEDKNGDFWIGTDGGGINVYDRNFTKLKEINTRTGLSDNAVLSALCDSEGLLWFGTFQGGVNCINPHTYKVTRYLQDQKSGISINNVRSIYETRDKKIWFGTDAGGLCSYDKKTGKFNVYTTKNSGISYDAIRTIVQDKHGMLWVGSYGEGLNRFNEQRNEFKTYRHDETKSGSIIGNTIQALHIDNKGRLWIGTTEGISLFHPESETFTSFTEQDGLINNNALAILEDKAGNLWISTNRGVSKFDYAKKTFENYDLNDGLQPGQYLAGSAFLSSNGDMFFGGTHGLNVFTPERITKTKFEPEILFTNFLLFNQPVPIYSEKYKDSPLKKSISITKRIELRHNQSIFTFDFVALNFGFSEKSQYSYILEGAENNWNNVGNKHSATYRNLKPGKYMFRVKATNQDGTWSSKSASIEVVVLPAFWQTWWAKTIYFLIFLAALYGTLQIYTFRMRSINRLRMERLERQKAEELNQSKLQFFTNISHEFRTPLTLIIGPLEKIIHQETDFGKKQQFNMMFRNANRLLRLVNQLLDLRKTERGQMHLKVQHIDLVIFISEIVFSFEELSHQKNIVLRFEHSQPEFMAWFDPEFLDKILFNLLSNAYKYTPEKGTITIEIKAIESAEMREAFEIVVSDTGRGIAANELKKIFGRFYQASNSDSSLQKGSGIGLHLSQALIELHHGTIQAESVLGQGSKFIIQLPRNKSSYSRKEISENTDYKEALAYPLSSVESEIPVPELPSLKTTEHKYSILVVEDDFDIRHYISQELVDVYNVVEASDGLEGIRKAIDVQPDLIISDVMMPELDGVEMCKQLKSDLATSHIPIILLTAKSSIENRIVGLENGADSYIPKPFNPHHLKVRIAKLIELREHLKQKFSKSINFEVKEIVATSPDEQFLQKAMNLITENLSNPDYNGDMLSKDIGMSRGNLHRKLKALLNQSSSEFIRNIRLKHAAQLLPQKKLTVSEICYEVGFSSPSYFTACFTNYFKMSPTEYTLKNMDKGNLQEDGKV